MVRCMAQNIGPKNDVLGMRERYFIFYLKLLEEKTGIFVEKVPPHAGTPNNPPPV